MSLTNEQQCAWESLVNGDNIFITGPGGCGKSHLIGTFKEWVIDNNKKIGITSLTGVSALLIGGTTIHSWAGIGLGKDSVDIIVKKLLTWNGMKGARDRWRTTDILVIDEISMMTPEIFEKLDRIGKILRHSQKPFGGIQLLLSGDFCQLRPVKSDSFCFESEKWNETLNNTFYFQKIMRQKDPAFQQCLMEVRLGELSEETIQILKNRISNKLENTNGVIPTILYSTRKDVSMINFTELKKLKEKNNSKVYSAHNQVIYEKREKMSEKQEQNLILKLINSCPVDSDIELTIDSQVMLLCNLNKQMSLVNGSRGVIVGFDGSFPKVRFISGVEMTIEPWTWTLEVETGIQVKRTQIPLRLAYAYTIHKSQGSTLDAVKVN